MLLFSSGRDAAEVQKEGEVQLNLVGTSVSLGASNATSSWLGRPVIGQHVSVRLPTDAAQRRHHVRDQRFQRPCLGTVGTPTDPAVSLP